MVACARLPFSAAFLALTAAAITAAAAAPAAANAPYDESLAIADLKLVQVTCCDVDTMANWTCGYSCQAAGPFDAGPTLVAGHKLDTLALVGERDGACAVYFRGSSNIMNWLTDFNFFPIKPYKSSSEGCEDCQVHSGFYDAYNNVAADIRAALDSYQCTNTSGSKPVVISGHSLGAATAVFAGFALANEGYNVQRLYTYGQPRVGDTKFVAAFSSLMARKAIPYYRIVDYMDAVPHLPTDDLFFEGWAHAGPEVYYNRTASGAEHYRVCTDPKDKRCSYQHNIAECLLHTCDHCSYLGMGTCNCGSAKPQCTDGVKG